MLLTVLSLRSQNIRMQSRLGQARLSRNFRRTKEIPDCEFCPQLRRLPVAVVAVGSRNQSNAVVALAVFYEVIGVWRRRRRCRKSDVCRRGLELRAADTTTEPVYIWTECHRVSYTSAANLTPLQHGRDGCRGDL